MQWWPTLVISLTSIAFSHSWNQWVARQPTTTSHMIVARSSVPQRSVFTYVNTYIHTNCKYMHVCKTGVYVYSICMALSFFSKRAIYNSYVCISGLSKMFFFFFFALPYTRITLTSLHVWIALLWAPHLLYPRPPMFKPPPHLRIAQTRCLRGPLQCWQ